MKKKQIFINSWNWLWLVALFYAITFFTWYMSFSDGPFATMASFRAHADPFSLLELITWTWEHFQFSWWDVLWIIIPSGIGYIIFAWRHTRLSFWLPTIWLAVSTYFYFTLTFAGELGIFSALREFPEYWQKLPWWFHILTHLSLFGTPVRP